MKKEKWKLCYASELGPNTSTAISSLYMVHGKPRKREEPHKPQPFIRHSPFSWPMKMFWIKGENVLYL